MNYLIWSYILLRIRVSLGLAPTKQQITTSILGSVMSFDNEDAEFECLFMAYDLVVKRGIEENAVGTYIKTTNNYRLHILQNLLIDDPDVYELVDYFRNEFGYRNSVDKEAVSIMITYYDNR
jgi:hypothetical protein